VTVQTTPSTLKALLLLDRTTGKRLPTFGTAGRIDLRDGLGLDKH
jgi:hypothetical protein